MVVGVLQMTLALTAARSLKEKRKVIRSIIERIRHRFHVSIAEVDANDEHGRAVIGVGAVANDPSFVNGVLDKVLDAVESGTAGRAELVDTRLELIHF